jgi:hypothetical protein
LFSGGGGRLQQCPWAQFSSGGIGGGGSSSSSTDRSNMCPALHTWLMCCGCTTCCSRVDLTTIAAAPDFWVFGREGGWAQSSSSGSSSSNLCCDSSSSGGRQQNRYIRSTSPEQVVCAQRCTPRLCACVLAAMYNFEVLLHAVHPG